MSALEQSINTQSPHAEDTDDQRPGDDHRRDAEDEAGSSADVNAPFAPHEEDDSPLGDSDQHSTA